MRHTGPLVLLALVVVAVLAPSLGDGAIGHAYGDMADHYWGTWWFGDRLLAGRLPTTTDISHFPMRLPLWYADPLGAALALPLWPLGPAGAYDGLVLVRIVLASFAAYAVAADLGGSRSAALVAGLVAGPSPYALGLAHSGLTEYLGLEAPTLAVWALVRTFGLDPRGRPPLRHGVALSAGLLVLTALQAAYYGLFAATVAACLVVGPGWRDRIGVFARVGALSAALGAPFAAGLLNVHLGGDGAVTVDNAPGWRAWLPATDVLTFVRPGAHYFPDTPRLGNPGILHVNYLGAVALGLAALGARSPARRLVPGLLAWAVLCLGPRLAVAGVVLPVPLPLALLYFPGSPWTLVHQPYRMVALLLPLLAVLAAAGARRLPPVARYAACALVLAETLLVSPAPWPVATRPVEPPDVYASLPDGPILDWPADATTWNRDYLVWQVRHGRPIPYGVNVFLPEPVRRTPEIAALLRTLDDPRARARNRDVPFGGAPLLPPADPASSLAGLGYRFVVVHRSGLSPGEWVRGREVLVAAFGDPLREDGRIAVWATR